MTVSDRKQREKELRRTEILNAAEVLFIRQGYDGTSVDDIAQATELSKGTIFLYYGSKSALYTAVVLRGVRELNRLIFKGISEEKTNLDKLRSIGSAVLKFSGDHPGHLGLMKQFASGRFKTDTETSDDAMEIIRLAAENDMSVIETIKDGVERGEIRNDVDPYEVALLLRFVTGGIMNLEPERWSSLDNRGIGREEFVEDLWQMIRRSISKEGSI